MRVVHAAIFCLGALSPFAAAGGPGAPDAVPRTPGELQALHASMLAQIKTVVFHETVIELREDPPNRDEKLRSNTREAYLRHYARALADDSLTEQQRTALQAELDERLATVEPMSVVRGLNRALALERTTTIDLAGGMLRSETRDLRDIGRLGIEHGLSETDLVSLDMTGVRILKGNRCIRLIPRAQKLALIHSNQAYDEDEEVYKLGLLPQSVFSSELELRFSELAPTVTDGLRLVGRRNGAIAVVAKLRADLGYRVTALKIFKDEKGCRQFTLSDFRKVDDMLIPCRTVRVDWTGVQDYLAEHREVRSASVNAPIPSDAFSVPPDYHVQQVGTVRD